MVNQHILLGMFLFANTFFIYILSFIDMEKRRDATESPFISVLIPVYNGKDSVRDALAGLYSSYEKSMFELFVINDASTDGTLKVLNKLKKIYGFTIINNKKNLGKSVSINEAFEKTRGEIVLILDADTILNRNAIDDLIRRFNHDEKLGASSCRQKPMGRGLMQTMQAIEYNTVSLMYGAHNVYTSIGLFGACLAVRRKAFKEAGLLSVNALTEDTDLALKLKEKGWKVEQSFKSVFTQAPDNFKAFAKQKIRWGAGFMQVFLRHFFTYFRNPVFVSMVSIFLFFALSFLFSSIAEFFRVEAIGIYFTSFVRNSGLGAALFGLIVYPWFSIPYTLSLMRGKRDFYKFLWIYPYALVYLPILAVIYVIGFIIGIYKTFELREGTVGWKG